MKRKPFFTGKLDFSTSQTIRQLFFAKYPVFFPAPPDGPFATSGGAESVV
ncbi:hypothetical protein [Dysosmobacter sp. HCP28S3_G4]